MKTVADGVITYHEICRTLPPITWDACTKSNHDLATRLNETMARIEGRVKGWQELEAEKIKALDWCRANGNPHLGAPHD